MEANVTILAIDDKPENIFALEKLLERPNRNFLHAASGKEGLKLALENDVDLIILDVQMPEMDGFEVAKVLKSHKRTKDIPIIFASAEKKERQSIMKGFEEGAVDYLPKPLDPELTKAKVSVLLRVQTQKKELMEKNTSLEKADVQIKQLNSELGENLERLRVANKELESFSYSVSHDLRAPLRILSGNAQILMEDFENKLDGDAKRLLTSIQKNAIRMNKLIDDLLQFSRLGTSEVRKSKVDIEALVENIVQEMGTSGHKAAITMNLSGTASVNADPALLTQVWVNLLSNAIKYSSKRENPTIEIGSMQQKREVVFYVKDNGAGFDMTHVDKLFGVFQRLHTTSQFEGTGVGLAIVHKIIGKHGGRVWAEAKVDEGATFYFSLLQAEG